MSALKSAISHQLSIFSLLIFLLFIANLFIFTPSVSAAINPCVGDWCPLSSDNYQDEVATQRFGRNILVFGHVALLGTNPLNGKAYSEKISYNTVNGQTVASAIPGIGPGGANDGALAMTTNAIASLYNPPTSSVEYLANLGENLGIAPKPAYAAVQSSGIGGSGDSVIVPVLTLWQVTRNIAYIAFILVFVAAGVMIMFRQKLNPQTVIGIQQALPGIVVGLILVTFSYFIAALMVDLAFVGTRLVAEIFISTNQTNYYGCTINCGDNPTKANNDGLLGTYQKSDAFDMYGRAALRVSNVSDVFSQVWGTLNGSNPAANPSASSPSNGVDGILKQLKDGIVNAIVGGVFGPIGGLFFTNSGHAAVGGVVATIASLLVPLILVIALMIQFIKLIIALVMSYLQILLMVIFGPILIMVSAIPGRGGTLNYWLKGLLANALVFPAVFAGFLFAGMLLEWDSSNLGAMPMFGGLSGAVLKSVLAFGVLLGLPSIPDMVREAFGVKAPQGFMQAAVGGFMGGLNTGRATATGGYNQAMERTGIRAQQQAYQKAQLEEASGAYTVQGGRITGGPGLGGAGWLGRAREFLVKRPPK